MAPAPSPYGTANRNSIQYCPEMEKPNRPSTVMPMETTTIDFVWNLRIIRGPSKAEITVMQEIVMETNPAYDEGTLKQTCMVGQPDPNRESGSPRLIKIR